MASDDGRDLSSQEKPRDSTRARLSTLGLIFIVLGLGVLVAFAVNVRNGVLSLSWPTTDGRVLSSSFETDEDGYWRANVTYSYEVAGVNYQGYDVHVSEMHWGDGQEHAQTAVYSYPAGMAVDVHYNPALPGRAVLEPGPNLGDSALLVFAALLFFLAVLSASPTTKHNAQT